MQAIQKKVKLIRRKSKEKIDGNRPTIFLIISANLAQPVFFQFPIER
jgi:hypothetical protein